MAEIKKITVGSTDYDLSAKYIQDENGVNKTWSDITALVELGFDLVVESSKPAASSVSYETYHNKIVLTPEEGHEGSHEEWVIVKGGTEQTPTYAWEKIGSTATDISGKVNTGTYTTGGPSSDSTGSAGEQTATGTATISYDKSDTATGSAGAGTDNQDTGSAGGFTIQGSTFTFTGTTATLSQASATVGVKIDKHIYQPEGSLSGKVEISSHSHTVNCATATQEVVTGLTQADSAGAHTHSVDSHTHGDNVTAITELNSNSITYLSGNTTKNYGFSSSVSDVMYNPTVSTLGVLSWSKANAGTQDSHTVATATFATTAKSTASVAAAPAAATLTSSSAGAHTHSLSGSTTNITFVTSATVSGAGAFTINGSSFSFTGTTATLTHTQSSEDDYNEITVDIPAVSINYQPAGSIGGSVTIEGHTHKYTKPAAHTHSIGLTPTSATGTAAVAVSNHTHSLGNHTHNVDLENN